MRGGPESPASFKERMVKSKKMPPGEKFAVQLRMISGCRCAFWAAASSCLLAWEPASHQLDLTRVVVVVGSAEKVMAIVDKYPSAAALVAAYDACGGALDAEVRVETSLHLLSAVWLTVLECVWFARVPYAQEKLLTGLQFGHALGDQRIGRALSRRVRDFFRTASDYALAPSEMARGKKLKGGGAAGKGKAAKDDDEVAAAAEEHEQ
jgi:hypothetical protein